MTNGLQKPANYKEFSWQRHNRSPPESPYNTELNGTCIIKYRRVYKSL